MKVKGMLNAISAAAVRPFKLLIQYKWHMTET